MRSVKRQSRSSATAAVRAVAVRAAAVRASAAIRAAAALAVAALAVGVGAAQESATPSGAIGRLVASAAQSVGERYSRPVGHVVERRRTRVYVAVQGELPKPGAQLVVYRPIENAPAGAERRIALLQVERVSGGLVECTQAERYDRERAEKNDIVRWRRDPPKLLLAPCLSLVDLVPVVPQVIGEQLRTAIVGRTDLVLVDDMDREQRAEAAYMSGNLPAFLRGESGVDEVLFPVLLQTPGKLLLNLEYFSVQRQRATQVDVAAVETDAMLLGWLRAGARRQKAPPGFRFLGAQLFPWRVKALAGGVGGALFAVSRDSVILLDFTYPGLQPGRTLYLGPREQASRAPYTFVLNRAMLPAGAETGFPENTTWVLSDERGPRVFASWLDNGALRVGNAAFRPESNHGLETLWAAVHGPAQLADHWYPGPGQHDARVLWPLFADLDGDGTADLVWTDERGSLQVQRTGGRARRAFRGYGDVKAVQPSTGGAGRAVLWLTDPVCCGAPDRVHAAQLVGDEVRLAWSSQPFDGTLTAVASHDLNADGAFDLVVAEDVADGTRIHVFLALPGEQTTARGMAMSAGDR